MVPSLMEILGWLLLVVVAVVLIAWVRRSQPSRTTVPSGDETSDAAVDSGPAARQRDAGASGPDPARRLSSNPSAAGSTAGTAPASTSTSAQPQPVATPSSQGLPPQVSSSVTAPTTAAQPVAGAGAGAAATSTDTGHQGTGHQGTGQHNDQNAGDQQKAATPGTGPQTAAQQASAQQASPQQNGGSRAEGQQTAGGIAAATAHSPAGGAGTGDRQASAVNGTRPDAPEQAGRPAPSSSNVPATRRPTEIARPYRSLAQERRLAALTEGVFLPARGTGTAYDDVHRFFARERHPLTTDRVREVNETRDGAARRSGSTWAGSGVDEATAAAPTSRPAPTRTAEPAGSAPWSNPSRRPGPTSTTGTAGSATSAEAEPAQSEPAQSEPAQSEPAQSEPAQSEPAQSGSAQPTPSQSEAARPASTQPEATPVGSDEAEGLDLAQEALFDAPNTGTEQSEPLVQRESQTTATRPTPSGVVASTKFTGGVEPLDGGAAPSVEFTIKGNSRSMLFHTPKSPYFGRTRAEVWFRTESEAESAGFRRFG